MKQYNTNDVGEPSKTGGLRVGDISSNNVVLIIGSCRAIPHLNYFNRYNEDNGNPFYICFIDPYTFRFDERRNKMDLLGTIRDAIRHPRFSEIFSRTKIFIHEHYGNYASFNTDKSREENVYQFGLNPSIDISIPNWNNVSVTFHDQIMFGGPMADLVRECGNPLSRELRDEMRTRGHASLDRWRSTCMKTSVPEFSEYFDLHWKTVRMFTSINHISNQYSVPLFSMYCKNFLGINMTSDYEKMLHEYDLFPETHGTPVTVYDREEFGIEWNCATDELVV